MPDTGLNAENSAADDSGTSESSPDSSSTTGTEEKAIQPKVRAAAAHLPVKTPLRPTSLTVLQAPHHHPDGPVHHVLKRL